MVTVEKSKAILSSTAISQTVDWISPESTLILVLKLHSVSFLVTGVYQVPRPDNHIRNINIRHCRTWAIQKIKVNFVLTS